MLFLQLLWHLRISKITLSYLEQKIQYLKAGFAQGESESVHERKRQYRNCFPTAAQVEQLYAPNLSKLTSVYEQVNLSKNIVQGQTFQSLELKDFYRRGIKEKLKGRKKKQLKQLNCSLAA